MNCKWGRSAIHISPTRLTRKCKIKSFDHGGRRFDLPGLGDDDDDDDDSMDIVDLSLLDSNLHR